MCFPASVILNITNQSCHHLRVIFYNAVYFFLWTAILSKLSIFYQLTSEKNEVHTGNLTHCRQTLQLINPLTPMSDQGRISPNNMYTISIR